VISEEIERGNYYYFSITSMCRKRIPGSGNREQKGLQAREYLVASPDSKG
jgi:hypothetical protein